MKKRKPIDPEYREYLEWKKLKWETSSFRYLRDLGGFLGVVAGVLGLGLAYTEKQKAFVAQKNAVAIAEDAKSTEQIAQEQIGKVIQEKEVQEEMLAETVAELAVAQAEVAEAKDTWTDFIKPDEPPRMSFAPRAMVREINPEDPGPPPVEPAVPPDPPSDSDLAPAPAESPEVAKMRRLAEGLFSISGPTRLSSYTELTSDFRRNPQLPGIIVKVANDRMDNEAGLRNALVTLEHISRSVTRDPKNLAAIEEFYAKILNGKYSEDVISAADQMYDWVKNSEYKQTAS